MKFIWKYPIEVTEGFALDMPAYAQILCIQVQNGEPQLWALVDPGNIVEKRCFAVYGTGQPLDSHSGEYLGTFRLRDFGLVYHIFERGDDRNETSHVPI
jgi:hypothetical protein